MSIIMSTGDVFLDTIELYCDLYGESATTVQHLTPFTTWLVRLTDVPSMAHVDTSQVDRITFTFIGSFNQ